MSQLGLLLAVVAVVFIMYNNINNITNNIEKTSARGYDFFAKLAGAAIEYIKEVKRDINGTNTTPEFILVGEDRTKPLKDLDDYIRKLAFYETVLAKKKKTTDIESEIADIFISFDGYIKENFKSGEKLADNLKESLGKIYQNN